MNKKIIIYLLGFFIFLSRTENTFAQVEYMINGGFEQWDNDDNNDGNPDDWYDFSIEYGIGWHNLVNTCDIVHPNYPFVSGTPRSGQACGRFATPQNGMAEFCYGITNPLVAGEMYTVSFWIRKDYSTAIDRPVGLVISESVPNINLNPYSTSQIPQVVITPTSTQYVKASFCFTAQNSVTHYVTIGPFDGVGASESILYIIDDVSVESIAPGTAFPSADINIPQTVYCTSNNVIIDGSATANEDGYLWEVFNISNGYEQPVYNTGAATGQVGALTLNTSNIPVIPGDCYRVYLTALGNCKDRISVEFCYEDPNIDFLNGTNAICEGVPIDLSVTGDNGWTYAWSTGQSGVGLKTIQVTPSSGPTINYSVTVTTPNGCVHTEAITFVVHSSDNQAPWMNGINGSGEYTIYVNAGDIVNFTSNPSNDNSLELVTYNVLDNISYPHLLNEPDDGSLNPLVFNWQTNPNISGQYYFTVNLLDNNACNSLGSSFTYNIIVICDHCPICISYENRTPSTTPLPLETKAGKCIEAGLSQPVSGGEDHIFFQAGQYILMGDYFDSGTDYEAIIEPTTCVADCEDCCSDWEGFTLDEIPDGVFINFEDDDPTNDYFEVTDIYHPFCAYGALGYQLWIHAGANTIHVSSFNSTSCCNLESIAPENPIPHSSIYWDGYTENIWGNQAQIGHGTYFYELTLYGCNGAQDIKQGWIFVSGSSDMPTVPIGFDDLTEEQKETVEATLKTINRLSDEISLSPNPSSHYVEISGLSPGKIVKAQLFDEKGVLIEKDLKLNNNQFYVSSLSPGTYFCKIMIDGNQITKKFVKI